MPRLTSIELKECLQKLPKQLLSDICFYLETEYDHNLTSFINLDDATAGIALKMIELLKLYDQGFEHLEKILVEHKLCGMGSQREITRKNVELVAKKALVSVPVADLANAMQSAFGLNDFKTLCFELEDVDYDAFPENAGLRGKMELLIKDCQYRDCYVDLVKKVLEKRPHLRDRLL
ncbi:hypothetical protein PN36_26705 [Candidatus Thiomargarita nelsonii]|uniref:Uncharacterized protein n=1 Tax=Candidatus Thiomargarita nelsonii TaxID=1003181 RepID=A0A0A6RVT2_9GAMM|nr:hypothetical protein PN36_26705 [Candidatus Thiomargarita nelsonii]